MKFKGLSFKRKSLGDTRKSYVDGDDSFQRRPKSAREEDFERVSIYATMRRPKKNPMSRNFNKSNSTIAGENSTSTPKNAGVNEAAVNGVISGNNSPESRVAVVHNVHNVWKNGYPLNGKTTEETKGNLTSTNFDDGYHTLPTRTNPWRNYDTDVLNTNQDIFSFEHSGRHTDRGYYNRRRSKQYKEHRKCDGDDNDDIDKYENIEYNDPKRMSSIKRRSKHARYSNPSLKSDIFENCPRDRSLSVGQKFVSESMLNADNFTENRKPIYNRRRSNEINRSTTLYWDDNVESPTSPETLVFNVSMKAKIQTRFKDTILHTAATNGNPDIVKFYVDSDQYLNAQNGFKNTPLHCAIMGRHADIIELFLEKKPELSLQNIDGDTVFHMCLKHSMESTLIRLLGLDSTCVNSQNNDGDTILHEAVRQNEKDIIGLLIEKGASLGIQNNDGDTPLHMCSALDMVTKNKLLRIVMESDKQRHNHMTRTNELNVTNDNCVMPLRQQSLPIVERVEETDNSNINNINLSQTSTIITCGRSNTSEESDLSAVTHLSETLSETEHADSLKMNQLLSSSQSMPDLCFVNVQNNEGNSLLHCFTMQQERELVKTLLTIPCTRVKLRNKAGNTALHLAVERNDARMLELLIQEDLELISLGNDVGDTVLHVSAYSGFVDIARKLITLGGDVNRQNEIGNTPLQSAIIGRQQVTLRLLLEKSIDLRVVNKLGDSAVHTAIKCGDVELFETLLDFISKQYKQLMILHQQNAMFPNGQNDLIKFRDYLDLNVPNRCGNTPLHVCIEEENFEMYKVLLRHNNINWNAANNNGDTALHLIARKNLLEFLELVDEKMISSDNKNKDGFTPWNIAVQCEHSDMAMHFLQTRWDINLHDNDDEATEEADFQISDWKIFSKAGSVF